MKYEDAIKVWGAKRLEGAGYKKVDPESVTVVFEFNEGYTCCDGTNPDCYCSFAESPSASIVIRAGRAEQEIDKYDFNFVQILKEIVDAGDGVLTDQ